MKERYESGLEKRRANYVPMTPVSFLTRAAAVYGDRRAVVYEGLERSWREVFERARRVASALLNYGVGRDDTVAVLLPNTPEMVELHFAVPMSGAVLNTLNTRLDAPSIQFMLKHAQAKILFVDREFSALADAALQGLERPPIVIDVHDPNFHGAAPVSASWDYEALVEAGDANLSVDGPADEWDAISLNYTSGTTGNPKGVVYSHRGAYLNALSNALDWDLPRHPVYLWTLPMFHCNGWCFPWTIAARAGVNVCLRRVETSKILGLIAQHRVTHYCGAPIVHSMLTNAPREWLDPIRHQVHAMVAGAAPSAALIAAMEEVGFTIRHVYGLTETYGPAAVCEAQPHWPSLELTERARLNSRQGVRYLLQEAIDVVNPESMKPVPADGETIGEVVFRGNICMKGYLLNPAANREAFAGGWFHTGDLGVKQPDGYIKLKDRSKDIIISGGENISSIEIEDALYLHPAVLAVAAVAKPDPKWGETPCAFVELKGGANVSAVELLTHCRKHLAGFKVPRSFEFCVLPKTSTGKIQKGELRARAGSVAAIDG